MFSAGSFQSFMIRDVLTFKEAVARHAMLRDALQKAVKEVKNNIKAKLIVAHCQDAWNQCMGAGDSESAMASAIRSCAPLEVIPLLRLRSGIPSAYLLVQLITALVEAHSTQLDISDDAVLRDVVTVAFDKFNEARATTAQLEHGFGFGRGDAWAQMRKVEDRSPYAMDLMKRIADLAGRMYEAFAYNKPEEKTRAPQEVDGVEAGGDFDRMLDDEAASIGIDPEAVVRVSEDRAVQYEMSGFAQLSRGPLVIAIDESGSMHDYREVWAKACAVALARVATDENRAVRVVHFSTVTDCHDVRKGNADDFRMLAESHTSGGTDIDVALQVANEQVLALEKEDVKGADLVFITDGLDSYGSHHLEEMKKRGCDLWTVAIDVDIKKLATGRTRWGHGASAHLYTYATAYVAITTDVIQRSGDGAIKAAVELKQSAMAKRADREEMR